MRHVAPALRTRAVLAIGLAAYGLMLVLRWYHGDVGGDFWEHAAALRELVERPFAPRHPIIDSAAPHAFFSPYLVTLAIAGHWLSLDHFTLLRAVGFANAGLMVLALCLLCRAFEQTRTATVLLSVLLVTFLWRAGTLPWSGFYHVDILGPTLSYPSVFAFVLSCIEIFVLTRWRRDAKPYRAAASGTIAGLVVLIHPPTAMFLYACLFGLYLEALIARPRQKAAALAVAAEGLGLLAVSIAVVLAWPYYPFVAVALHGDPVFDAQSRVLYDGLARGTAWLPFALLAPFVAIAARNRWRRRPGDRLVVALVVLAAIYALAFLAHRPGFGRVVSQVHLLSCLLAAQAITGLFESADRRRLLASALPVIGLCAALALHQPSRSAATALARAAAGESVYPDRRFAFLAQHVDATAVILAERRSGNAVAAFAGRVVAANRPLHLIADAPERRRAVATFFAGSTKLAQRCIILRNYNVTHVLLPPAMASDIVGGLGTVVHDDGRYRLLRIDGGACMTGG